MCLFVVGFEREAHQQAASLARSQLGGDVARAAQGERHLAVAFPEFGLRRAFGRVVGHSGAHHGAVRLLEGAGRGVVHFRRRKHVHAFDARRRRQRRASRDEGDFRTPGGQLAGEGVSHFARRVVRDEPHGVDGFDRGPGRDDHAFTREALFFFSGRAAEQVADECGDFGRFGHAALAAKTAGQLAFARLRDPHTALRERPQVPLRRLVGVHVEVHGRGHDDWTACRKIGREQQVVRDARCHFGQRVGRGRGDQVAVGPFAQRDVGVPCAVLRVEELHQNRIFRERGHRQRRDELLGQRRHHDAHFGARRLQ